MFERFTERARQVVVLAQEESRLLNNDYIGAQHILLGCIKEDEGIAAHVLKHLNVSPEPLRTSLYREPIKEENILSGGQIPFTPTAKKALELALREALTLGHNYIGTEHILLGLIREPGTVLESFLRESIDNRWRENIKLEVMEMLRGPVVEKDPELSEAEKKELELKDVLADLLIGYRMWKEVKGMNQDEWTDADEAFARWIDGSKVSEFL